jgi:hypothetical protein
MEKGQIATCLGPCLKYLALSSREGFLSARTEAFSSWRSKGGIVARVKKRLQLFCGHVNTSLTNSKLVKL